jgi:hypothetical protein
MRKTAARPTTLFTFAQRADITITRHTADVLTVLLMRKEAFRRKWQDKEYRQDVLDYSMMGAMGMAAGTLFALVITFMH